MTVRRDERIGKFFRLAEFRCKCRRKSCDAWSMDKGFIAKLDQLRELWGKPLLVNSGVRCAYWNGLINGSPKSQHLLGKAADLALSNPNDGPRLAALAEKLQFGGIGIAGTFIHVDDGPSGRRWTYD